MTSVDQVTAEQDFDALSEDSYDFGHFHELDSDADEPEIEKDSLDPFTAAQREQAASQTLDGEAELDEDDQFSFTQRLLTNARTLKELNESGRSALEIVLEDDEDERASTTLEGANTIPGASSHPHLVSHLHTHTPRKVVSQRDPAVKSDTRLNVKTIPTGPLNSAPFKYSFTQHSYDILVELPPEALVSGNHESFPAGLLRSCTFEQCQLILGQTRRFRNLPAAEYFQPMCLQSLWKGNDLGSSPVFRLLGSTDSRILLQDYHESQCSVIGMLTTQSLSSSIESVDSVRLIDFYFDHAAVKLQPKHSPGKVTIEDEPDEELRDSFFSSQHSFLRKSVAAEKMPDPMVSQDQATQSSTTKSASSAHTSILIINRYEMLNLQEWITQRKAQQDQKAASQRLYEGESQTNVSTTQATVETNYSDQFESFLDVEDFPLEQSR